MGGETRRNELRLLCTQEVASSNLASSTQECHGSRVTPPVIRGILLHNRLFQAPVPSRCHGNVTGGLETGPRRLIPLPQRAF